MRCARCNSTDTADDDGHSILWGGEPLCMECVAALVGEYVGPVKPPEPPQDLSVLSNEELTLLGMSGVSTTPASEPPRDIKAQLVHEAERIVTGARRGAYGTPEDNFERIARFWNAYMANTGRDVTITAADVSPMMRLTKEARLCETPDHYDSHLDLVGYTLTGAEVNGVKP